MDRFNQVALQIRNLNSEVALHHMVMAFRLDPFTDSLCEKPAANMNEMRERAAKFMHLEELRDFGGQLKAEHSGSQYRPDKERASFQDRTKERVPFLPPPPVQPKETRLLRFANYTPLNTNRGEFSKKHSALTLYLPSGKQQPLGMPISPSTVVFTKIKVTPQRNVWH